MKPTRDTPGIRRFHPGQDDHTGGLLHQRPDGRAIAGAGDEVALSVAGHRAGGHRGGPLGKRVIFGIWPRQSVPRAQGRRA